MEFKIKGGHSINELNVTSNSGLTVNTPTVLSKSGYVILASEVDAGDVLGYKTIRPYYVTQDYRTLRNFERPIWQDVFNTTVLNSSKYRGTTTNQTIVLSGASLNLNGNFTTATGDFSIVQTHRTFSMLESGPTYINFKTRFPNSFQNNNVIEFGLATVTGSTTPTDGIFFRVSAGTLNAVVSYSGTETTAINVYTPTINQNDDYLLAVTDISAEFWVNDVIVASITPTATTIFFSSSTVQLSTAGYATSASNALTLFMRNRNTGVVSSPVGVSFSSINVLLGDFKSNKDYRASFVTNGQSSIATPDGQPFLASGNTSANIINNTAPNNINALDNTIAGYTTFGGDFSILSTGGSETDYVVFAYLNPVGTVAILGKTLVISNVYVNTFTSGATMATTGTTLQWTIGVGGTSVSLTEQDSVTGGTRSARRLGLGVQSIAPSVVSGTMADRMIMFEAPVSLYSPLMVEAGTYCHIILKIPVGIATSSLYYRGNIIINGYWE